MVIGSAPEGEVGDARRLAPTRPCSHGVHHGPGVEAITFDSVAPDLPEPSGARVSDAPSLTSRPEFQALQRHYAEISQKHLRELFDADPERGTRLALEAEGIYLDYSKHRIVDETVTQLVALAKACGLRDRIDAMFRGDRINVTENRSVLHVALRAPRGSSIVVDGRNVV